MNSDIIQELLLLGRLIPITPEEKNISRYSRVDSGMAISYSDYHGKSSNILSVYPRTLSDAVESWKALEPEDIPRLPLRPTPSPDVLGTNCSDDLVWYAAEAYLKGLIP